MPIRFTLYLIFLSFTSFAQESIDELLKLHNTQSVPYISVQELRSPSTEAIILDARAHTEFHTSHIQNAIHVGYDNFNIETVKNSIKDTSKIIVVYCSLGIRSEDVAEQLKKAGYTNVYNLFGGIFEWKNNDFPVYDNEGELTDQVHAFSEEWGRWLIKGIKVYD